jgi:uncharacterized protein YdeI (YjbR/CyaY-like superfamily)
LNSNKAAKINFKYFSESVKEQIFHWIKSDKREETRKNRIQRTILLAAQNKKPP